MTDRASLPLPRGLGWLIVEPTLYSQIDYEVSAKHQEDTDTIRVEIMPADPALMMPTVSISLTAEQWANVFAVVASVSPKPVRSMVQELKHGV